MTSRRAPRRRSSSRCARVQRAVSKRCCSENSQTPRIDATTMTGTCTSSTSRQPSSATSVPNRQSRASVGEMDRPALAHPAARRVERHAIEQQEDQRRQQQVGDQRMARQAVEQALPGRQREILAHREAGRIDVGAAAAAVEVVPVGVMQAVLAAQLANGVSVIRLHSPADQRIGAPRGEERAVAAIVLNDEDAHQQRAGRQREREREPRRQRVDQIHRHAAGEEGTERGAQVELHRLRCDGRANVAAVRRILESWMSCIPLHGAAAARLANARAGAHTVRRR